MFYYEIDDGEAYIFAINDNSVTSVEIPEFIDDYPVTKISQFTFEYCFNLEYINGIKLKEGVNIINNKFIYHERRIYTIKYQICDDYCDDDELFIDNNYFRFTFEITLLPIARRVFSNLLANDIVSVQALN